jgi:hypothetical protein
MFAEISNKQQWVAAPHLPFPGIGHVYKVNAEQYQWIPYILITVLINKKTGHSLPCFFMKI